MFRNREDAALQLVHPLQKRLLHRPVILAIPRGGVALGAVLARELDADLNIILAHKLRDPMQMELALGAISETGEVYLTSHGEDVADSNCEHLIEECRHQTTALARQRKLYGASGAIPSLEGRSVIVVDDGVATAATMIAALKMLRSSHHGKPYELLVAVPVGSPEGLDQIKPYCDAVICLHQPTSFWAVGAFYRNFDQVEDEAVIEMLREAKERQPAAH